MAIVNKQMGGVFAEIAKELLACENVASSSKRELQDVIDNPDYSYGSISIDFVKEDNSSYTSKCTLNLKFLGVDGEYSDLKEDEHGDEYRDYKLVATLSWGATADTLLEFAQPKIDLMNEVMNIGKRVCESYKNDVIRHIHVYFLKNLPPICRR